jgi:oligoendopeptidase F
MRPTTRMRQLSLFSTSTPTGGPPRWVLDDLYASDNDPAMELDRNACIQDARSFESDYMGNVGSLDAAGLVQALSRLEHIGELEARVLSWADLRFAADTADPDANRLLGMARALSAEVRSGVVFFFLEWSELTGDHTDRLMSEQVLGRFRHALIMSRRFTPHRLSQAEERLIERLSPAGPQSWAALWDKVVGAMSFGREERPLSQVLKDFSSPDRMVRRDAADALNAGIADHLPALSHVLGTVAVHRRITDDLRGFGHWLGERALGDEVAPDTIDAMAALIRQHFHLARRYYRIKANVLEIPDLMDYDRSAPLGPLPGEPYTWGSAREIVRTAFRQCSPRLGEIAGMFLDRGWIDAAVRQDKRAGAFCHPTVPQAHPYILMSFGGTSSDLLTLAHELGHGIHQYLSRGQTILSATPLPMAETAALFGESLVLGQLMEQGDARQRLVAGCLKAERIMATTFRQASLHLFERSVHETVRSDGAIDPGTIGRLFLESQKELYGESMGLSPGHERWWAVIPHFVHTPGYVYAYAMAQLTVLALYSRMPRLGEGFSSAYERVLSLGGSRPYEELLEELGLDPRSDATFREGLSALEGLLDRLDELAGQAGEASPWT